VKTAFYMVTLKKLFKKISCLSVEEILIRLETISEAVCKRFDNFMVGHGYSRSSYCVYYRQLSDGSLCMPCLLLLKAR
jgi:hypothetical protein